MRRELAATIRLGLGLGLEHDATGLLARAREDLADADVVANAAVMMFGGIETTEGMIATLFPRPDEYALDRANLGSQLAFARGPHACIAMDLARLETRVALGAVLDRLPPLRLTAPPAVTGLVFRKPAGVHVAALE